MNRRTKFGLFMVAVLLAPVGLWAAEFETVMLIDLPEEIRRDVFLYVGQNIDAVSNHDSPSRVQRLTTAKGLQVRLEYEGPAAEKENDPAIEVLCTYQDSVREQCSHRLLPPGRIGPLDPPLPELQRPIIDDSEI